MFSRLSLKKNREGNKNNSYGIFINRDGIFKNADVIFSFGCDVTKYFYTQENIMCGEDVPRSFEDYSYIVTWTEFSADITSAIMRWLNDIIKNNPL